jgi:hypothetical protein
MARRNPAAPTGLRLIAQDFEDDESHDPQEWSWRKIKGPTTFIEIPEELEPLCRICPDGDAALETLKALHSTLIETVENDSTNILWEDRRGYQYAPITSLARVEMVDRIHGYDREIVAAMAHCNWDAITKIRQIVKAEGYRVVPDSVWGGIKLVREDDVVRPDVPIWRVNEEIGRLRRVFEYLCQRPLTRNELDTVVRGAAEERLWRIQNESLRKFGVDLRQYESAKRSDRRRRAEARYRREHVRFAPRAKSLRERLIEDIVVYPEASLKKRAEGLAVGPKAVSEELRKMEQDRVIEKDIRGRKHLWRMVPEGVPPDYLYSPKSRVAVDQVRVRIDDIEADDDIIQETARRLRRAPRGGR